MNERFQIAITNLIGSTRKKKMLGELFKQHSCTKHNTTSVI